MILKDRHILVTGGAGFIGSHVVDRLVQHNRVTVFDNLSSGTMAYLEHHMDCVDFTFIEGDLMDPDAISMALDGIDMVFHLAANPDVRLGAEDTKVHLEQNVLTTYNLIEAMRTADASEIVFTSTSTVYGMASV
ncbi:MAG: NAD-dependent epimerase/dehydratase family protein, partial [ANME-2 cluster archaeon]|nr:NAD-dependent epimerase/dehydratase family protein [ANME-2 cluster archaeon]